jgi:hypothetical protein
MSPIQECRTKIYKPRRGRDGGPAMMLIGPTEGDVEPD